MNTFTVRCHRYIVVELKISRLEVVFFTFPYTLAKRQKDPPKLLVLIDS